MGLSGELLLAPDLGASIKDELDSQSIDRRLIEFEITETSVMKKPDEAIRTLQHIQSLGVRLAVDDFGTGYSSLAYLKRLPVQTLKIDRSFIRDIPHDADDVTITLAVISMARSLGLTVVAEGVETEAQLAFLKKNKCDEAQGFLFSRPLSALEFEAFLSREHRGAEVEPGQIVTVGVEAASQSESPRFASSNANHEVRLGSAPVAARRAGVSGRHRSSSKSMSARGETSE